MYRRYHERARQQRAAHVAALTVEHAEVHGQVSEPVVAQAPAPEPPRNQPQQQRGNQQQQRR